MISGGPFLSRPLCFATDIWHNRLAVPGPTAFSKKFNLLKIDVPFSCLKCVNLLAHRTLKGPACNENDDSNLMLTKRMIRQQNRHISKTHIKLPKPLWMATSLWDTCKTAGFSIALRGGRGPNCTERQKELKWLESDSQGPTPEWP